MACNYTEEGQLFGCKTLHPIRESDTPVRVELNIQIMKCILLVPIFSRQVAHTGGCVGEFVQNL